MRTQTMLTKLAKDTRGIFYTAIIIIIVLFVSDIMYITVALVGNTFFDIWVAGGYVTNIQMADMLSTLRYVGPIVIVIINIGLIGLLVVSAWKRGRNEAPEDLLV